MQQAIKEGKLRQPKFITGKDGKQRQLPFMLNKAGQADRKACLAYANALCRNLVNMRASVVKDNEHYKRMSQKLKKVNDYALHRYNDIQHSIFVNGDQNYLEVLASMPMSYHNAKADVNEKYNTEKVKTADGTERKFTRLRHGLFAVARPHRDGLECVCAVLHCLGSGVEQCACALDCAQALPHGEFYEEEGVPNTVCGYAHLCRVGDGGTHVHVAQFLPYGVEVAH